MSEAQRALVDRIVAGPRKEVPVNLEIWLHNLPFAEVAERFGEYVSQRASMSKRIKEIIILTIASVWDSEFERNWHEKIGGQAGLSQEQMAALRSKVPAHFDDPQEQVSYEVAHAVSERCHVPDELHHRAVKLLGHRGVSDIVGLMGLYSMIAWTLSFYQVPVPRLVAR